MEFKPNIPTRRKKQEKQEITVKKERKKRERKVEELVASGPFAMGPADRTRTNTFNITSTSIEQNSINSKIISNEIVSDSDDEPTQNIWYPQKIHYDSTDDDLLLFQFPSEIPVTNGTYSINNDDGDMVIRFGDLEFEVHKSNVQPHSIVKMSDKYIEIGHSQQLLICTPIIE